MYSAKAAFSSFSVDDLAKARQFYGDTLGLTVTEVPMGLNLQLPGCGTVFVYPKPDHQPATFTVLNLGVDDIDEAVTELDRRGVHFECYEAMHQDEKGIMRPPAGQEPEYGPPIAWFKDPAGNVVSVIETGQ